MHYEITPSWDTFDLSAFNLNRWDFINAFRCLNALLDGKNRYDG